MSQSPQDLKHDEKAISRRAVLKGGAATVAGAFATMLAARRGSAAVTSMDSATLTRKKKGGSVVSTNAVTSMD